MTAKPAAQKRRPENMSKRGGLMQRCDAKTGGICARDATWRQSVHAGKGDVGRFLYYSYWCDEHAGRVAEHRAQNWIPPAKMTQIVPENA